jgi:hypothetical protein
MGKGQFGVSFAHGDYFSILRGKGSIGELTSKVAAFGGIKKARIGLVGLPQEARKE